MLQHWSIWTSVAQSTLRNKFLLENSYSEPCCRWGLSMLVFCLLLWVWVLHGVTNSTTGDSGRPKLTGIDWLSGSETHCRAECRCPGEHWTQNTQPRYRHHVTHTGSLPQRAHRLLQQNVIWGLKRIQEDTGTLFMREPREQVSGWITKSSRHRMQK